MLNLDSFGAVDPNGIFPLFFINTADFMAPKVSIVLCKLARMGSCVSCWRYSNVTPLSKSGSPSSIPGKYRPILITPVLSNVFEHLLAKHFNAYAETNDLFPSLQYGFCKCLGTYDAPLTITNAVQKSLGTGCEVCMISLDFSSAFDHVNQEALIFKLGQMGIGGTFLNIIIEFLTGRKQRVVVDGQCIDYRNVLSGVPQSIVLGPLLLYPVRVLWRYLSRT